MGLFDLLEKETAVNEPEKEVKEEPKKEVKKKNIYIRLVYILRTKQLI